MALPRPPAPPSPSASGPNLPGRNPLDGSAPPAPPRHAASPAAPPAPPRQVAPPASPQQRPSSEATSPPQRRTSPVGSGELPWSDASADAAPATGALPFEVEPEGTEQYPVAVPAPTENRAGLSSNVLTVAESYGYAGLDLNAFGVLPTVSLKDGVFKTGDGSIVFGEEFYFNPLGGKEKFVYKTDTAQNDPRSDLFYTYDNLYTAGGGQSVEQRLEEWKRAGLPYSRKDYIDLRLAVDRGEGLDPMLAILSIPPTSKANYTSLVLSLMTWANATGRSPSERLVKAYKGPLVTKVKFPFNPIKFELQAYV